MLQKNLNEFPLSTAPRTSLTKHKFKDKVIPHVEMATTAEH